MAAIDIDGGVPSTTLNGAITSGATSITVADGSSYPDGTNGNFYIVIDLSAATEETIECSARSSNTLTVATRGADGTSAASHDNGATVQHVVPALTLQEANTHANTTTGTPHGSAYVTPSGNVATATALATARTIVLSGDVSGTSGSFDGTANATITTTIADDSHNHTDSTITGTLSNDTSGNAATATVLATARTIGGVSFNGSANITLPGVNATGSQDTTGTALTATGLETARTIGGVSFDGTTNINLPGVNTAGDQDTSGTAAVATTATLTDAGTDTTCFPVLAGAATGNEGLETDASALTYNASTGTLSATNLDGALTTAAQTSITQVGTLTSLTVSGGVEVQGLLDVSNQAKIEFGNENDQIRYDDTDNQFQFWMDGNKHATLGNPSIRMHQSGGTLIADSPPAGTGNDAEWAVFAGTNVLFQNTSVAADKENISADLGTNLTAAMIDSVVPKMWNRITAPGIPEIGPIADEIDDVSPFLAAHGTDADGDRVLTGINKTAWMSLMTLALQDIRARLAAIEG